MELIPILHKKVFQTKEIRHANINPYVLLNILSKQFVHGGSVWMPDSWKQFVPTVAPSSSYDDDSG
jgi:hypothetical protein